MTKGRKESAGEEGSNRGVGHTSVNDHADAGRNQNTHAAGSADDGCRPGGSVACLVHGRDHDRPDGRRIGCGGTGDTGKEDLRDDRNHSQAVSEMADQGAGQVNEPERNPSGVHQGPCQDEQRDGKKRKGIAARKDLLGQDDERNISFQQKAEDRGQTHAEGNRYVNGDKARGKQGSE